MKKLCLLFALFCLLLPSEGQRLSQPLGRGIVATSRNGQGLISWRRLAQDPEGACYNVYVNGVKQNASPLAASNLQKNLSDGAQITVSLVRNGVEEAPSAPFVYHKPAYNNDYMRVRFREAGSPLPDDGTYVTKFCWPVDLDGDGEYDFVVDRIHTGSSFTNRPSSCVDCVEAYSSTGKHLWTVQLGPNIFTSTGQNDGVTVGDFDADGKGEVMVQASDSCRLWDSASKTWGRWMAYGDNPGDNPDIDLDGVINYTHPTQSGGKNTNPQYYMLVIDGMTGAQKDICPMTLPKDHLAEYTRKNKSAWMGDEYSYMTGAMGTAYLDGIHASAVCQFQVRNTAAHHYFTYGYGYYSGIAGDEGNNGKFHELFTFAFHDNGDPSEFHHLRQGDVDMDGKDETMNGAYALDHDGKKLWDSGIHHGDRFRLSDIDPERPGQEIYAIQQNAPDMLGQLIYSASDGSSIKRWYLGAVGDVGRGECADVVKSHKGYEMWSTMPNMYDAKGNLVIEGTHSQGSFPFPTESVWWDGDLDREQANAPDGKYNIDIRKFNYSSGGTRLIEMAKESGYVARAEYGIRPMFWGDIIGDWREEIICKTEENGIQNGFIIYTTNHATSVNNIYCLQQDPGYNGQCTNRGYYQSPNTSFYLGYDMPRPALPPYIRAQRTWGKEDSNWTSGAESSILFGLGGNREVLLVGDAHADSLFVIAPADYDYHFGGNGNLCGREIWKSGVGKALLGEGVGIAAEGRLYISEGTLELQNGTIHGPVELRARGTLAGNVTVDGTLSLEGALNYEGCRLMPSEKISVKGDLAIDHLLYVELSEPSAAVAPVQVEGTVSLTDSLCFTLPADLAVGRYPLLSAGDLMDLPISKVGVRGNDLREYTLSVEGNILYIDVTGYTVKEPRTEPAEILWTGAADGTTWDFATENWQLADGTPTNFVNGDRVTFQNTDNGASIMLNEKVTVAGMMVNNTHPLPIVGTGAIGGQGSLVKMGSGQLSLSTSGQNSYSGGTYLVEGALAQGQYTTVFGRAGDTIHVTSGRMQQFYTTSSGNAPTFNYVYNIPEEDNSLYITETGRGQIRGTVVGKGTLTLYNNYVRADNYLNLSDFEGTLSLESPADYSEHRFINTTVDMKKACLHLTEWARAQGYKAGGGTTQDNIWNVGSVTGKGKLGSGTWNIGYDNTDFTFGADITTPARINKYGSGQMSIATGVKLAGSIYIYEGGLFVYNTNSSNIPCSGGIVASGEKAYVQISYGYVQQLQISNGATLRINNNAKGSSTAYTNAYFILNGGKMVVRKARTGKSDYLYATGKAELTDPTFIVDSQGFGWAAGDTICPVQSKRTFTVNGTVTVLQAEGDELAEGLYWDTTTFAEDGVIRLRDANTGLNLPWKDERGNTIVYDLQGRRVEAPRTGEMYLIEGRKQRF